MLSKIISRQRTQSISGSSSLVSWPISHSFRGFLLNSFVFFIKTKFTHEKFLLSIFWLKHARLYATFCRYVNVKTLTLSLIRNSHRMCSIKKLFLKLQQNSQENTCARLSFLKKMNFEFCQILKTFLQNNSGRTLPLSASFSSFLYIYIHIFKT